MRFFIQKFGSEQDAVHRYQLWFESDNASWNAMEGTLSLTPESILSINTGGSALGDWVEPVKLDKKGLSFQGFTLNGVPQANKHLIIEWVQDASLEKKPAIFLNNYRVLKHDGYGSVLISGNQELLLEKPSSFQDTIYWDENQTLAPSYLAEHYHLIDKNPPQKFHPFLQESAIGELYFIYKSYDAESGIDKYQIIFEDASFLEKETPGIYWLKTKSSMPLEVWTYDRAGNIQKESIRPLDTWIDSFVQRDFYTEWSLLFFFMLLLFVLEWHRHRILALFKKKD